MDDAHPDIAAATAAEACGLSPRQPVSGERMGFGGLQDASAAAAQVFNAILSNHLISKASTLLDHLNSIAAKGDAAAGNLAEMIATFKTDLEAIVTWLKAQLSPPAPAKLSIFHRGDDLATALEQHAASTAQSLARIIAAQQTELAVLGHEAQVLDALSSAVTTLLSEPGLTINPTLIQGQVSRLKAATDALAAALAKNPLPKS